MIVLALDTTTRAGSVALVANGTVLREAAGDPDVTHGERLPLDLIRILDDAGLSMGEVDLLGVAAGPGSFTGLRVGIATIQGLAVAAGKRVVPVSALEALARAAADGTAVVAPWMDAQRGEVFAALYDPSGRTPLTEPTSLPPAATIAGLPPTVRAARLRFAGDGALRYVSDLRAALGAHADVLPDVPLLAGVIGQIACDTPERAVRPHAVSPIYVRRPDAELARDRRARRA